MVKTPSRKTSLTVGVETITSLTTKFNDLPIFSIVAFSSFNLPSTVVVKAINLVSIQKRSVLLMEVLKKGYL